MVIIQFFCGTFIVIVGFLITKADTAIMSLDLRWKVVVLYFHGGWSVSALCVGQYCTLLYTD